MQRCHLFDLKSMLLSLSDLLPPKLLLLLILRILQCLVPCGISQHLLRILVSQFFHFLSLLLSQSFVLSVEVLLHLLLGSEAVIVCGTGLQHRVLQFFVQ